MNIIKTTIITLFIVSVSFFLLYSTAHTKKLEYKRSEISLQNHNESYFGENENYQKFEDAVMGY